MPFVENRAELWTHDDPALAVEQVEDGVLFTNSGDHEVMARLVFPGYTCAGLLKTIFNGRPVSGSAGICYVVDEFHSIMGELTINSTMICEMQPCDMRCALVKVFPHSAMVVQGIDISLLEGEGAGDAFVDSQLGGDVAVVVPTYPSHENRYLCAFVHTRVKAYLEAGLTVDVLCAFDYDNFCIYDYEGVRVVRMPIDQLSQVLARRSYKVVCSHFFDERYAEQFDAAGLDSTPLLIWTHNPETRYWETPKFATPYFSEPIELTDEQRERFELLDGIIKRYNQKANVRWVFISQAQLAAAQKDIGITFNRASVIPNIVDENLFAYDKDKDPELRKRIYTVRKFEDVATYAIDLDVACIVELSKRDFFDELEFDIYGDGPMFDELTQPVAGFANVHLHPHFLSHEQIAQVHREHGIALFATRFDSQGVSMGEAAMSGLAVVSSDIDAARCFLPTDQGLLCEVENPVAYADAIERLYRDPAYFKKACKACHKKVNDLCRRAKTVNLEIKQIAKLGGLKRKFFL